jgi:hypothetical protein
MPIVSCLPLSIVGRDQDRIAEPGRLEVEQPTEAADLAIRAGAAGGAHQRLDLLDHQVAGVDVDARIRIGEPAFRFAHPPSSRES